MANWPQLGSRLDCRNHQGGGSKLVVVTLSEDRTLENVKNCAWWPSWRKETIEYCHTWDRCQKANR
ncbi:hypothetical protein O181_114542, partial [Austropuccinia psidii MF-1]|nr:hypothetical protein [Austropuccinia psidii MF-1]